MTPIDAGEYQSAVGLRDLYIAEVTEDSQDAYTAGTPAWLGPAMTASEEVAVNQKTQYADDGPFAALTAEGETKITLEATNLPLSVEALITGSQFDAVNGLLYDNAGSPPDYALGFRSLKANGSYRYYWFPKGKFSKPSQDKATRTDTPDPKQVKIVFTAVKTIHQFDLGTVDDGVKLVKGDEDATGFDATGWFSAVQTPPEIAS